MEKYDKIPENLIPKIEKLFENHWRVDFTVEAVFEGQTGQKIKIFTDDGQDPQVVQILRDGYTIFAGNTKIPAAELLIKNLPVNYYIMPSGQDWIELANSVYGDRLKTKTRYSFSNDEISQDNIELLIEAHPQKDSCRLITLDEAKNMSMHKINKAHFMNFESPEHFMRAGFGYGIKKQGEMAAACTSSLVCKNGVEVNVITLPEYRQKGYAFLCALKFLRHSLQNNLYANWDASDEMSADLAKKLGYTFKDEYKVYYID
ncbi:MAG: GNAT family N-acetyltransferase [Bacteroidota bacterium]